MKLWALSLAAALAAATPALASSDPTLTMADIAGDANGINDGGEFFTGNRPTPTSQPTLDLRGIRLAPIVEGSSRTGLTVTFRMQAPVADRLQVTVTADTPNCPDINLRYAHGAGATGLLSSGCSKGLTPVAAEVRGNTVTLTVPFSVLPAKARQDNVLNRVNAYSQVHLASTPPRQPTGSSMIDTTLQGATYRLR